MRIWAFSLALAAGCPQPSAPPAPAAATAPVEKPSPATVPHFADGEHVVLIDSTHDTLGGARGGLEAALRLPVDLPLPFPRVERHGDQFRVVLGRGPFSALRSLTQRLYAAGHPMQVLPVGQAGNDDVIRLGIICTAGEAVPLYSTPLTTPLHELTRLRHGHVVVLKEDEDEPQKSGDDDDATSANSEVERGYLTVLQPQLGLLQGVHVLLPADCTPRDEDNDDGNGRILAVSDGVARLCLTTRFAGRVEHVAHADVVAVTPNYRRCLRFPGAGTFDGFDHTHNGNHFAVEADGGLRLYAVKPHGDLQVRGQWPGLSRPAFLDSHLVATIEEATTLSLVAIEGIEKRDVADQTPLPAPRRIIQLAVPDVPKLPADLSVQRPAAPTLSNGRVRASFLRGCRPDSIKRVRLAAGKRFVQCVLEIEVEVGFDGVGAERHCRLDNAQNALEEPMPVGCP